MPDFLKLHLLNVHTRDPPSLMSQRFALEFLFHKSCCILHRRYLVASRSDPQYCLSRQSCIDSAMQMLKCQSVIHHECKQGGHLYQERWKFSSHISHGSLLAAMIICLDLGHGLLQRHPRDADDLTGVWRTEDLSKALGESYEIWIELGEVSKEALRASRVVKAILSTWKSASSEENPSTSSMVCESTLHIMEDMAISPSEFDWVSGNVP